MLLSTPHLLVTRILVVNYVIPALNVFYFSGGGLHSDRTLTQEDHGDNQITLEDATQLVSDGQEL